MAGPPANKTEKTKPGRKAGKDALSEVLRVAHLTGGVFLHADFFAPWCIAEHVGPEHCAPLLPPSTHLILYHYVVEGDFRIRVEGEDGEDLTIGPGEVVLLPRNDLHLMGSDLSLPSVAGSDIIRPPQGGGLFSIHHGGSGRRTRMICGFLGCASAEGNPVISTLPSMLKLNVSKAEPENGSAQHSNTPRRRSPLVVQDRRPCWPSFGAVVRGGGAAVCGDPAGRPDRMARWFARASRCAGTGAITPRHHPALDRR